MRFLALVILVLSAVGFVLGLLSHFAAMAGHDLLVGEEMAVLDIGAIVVGMAAMLLAARMSRGLPASRGAPWRQEGWGAVLSGCPRWMQWLLFALFVYTGLNFYWALHQTAEHARESTPEAERALATLWLMFYYAAFVLAVSAYRKPALLAKPR